MFRKGFIILIVVACSALLYKCEKPQIYPVYPLIEYKSYYLVDSVDILGNVWTAFILTFGFTDGDGDIGLRDEDIVGPYAPDSLYYYNLFLTVYEKVNGEFIEKELNSDLLPYAYRIPYISINSSNEALKGEIEITELDISQRDTIKIEFYMVDRALHESNVVTTPELLLNTGP